MTQKKTTDITPANSNELSIQLSLSGLSFCIYNKFSNTVIALEHHSFSGERHPETITRNLGEHFEKNRSLQQPFKNVSVIHENELSAFVPKAMFREENLPGYLKFNVKILENDFIAHDSLKNHDLVNVYIPYMNVNNFLFERFGAFEYRHFSSVLVNALLNKAPWKKTACMFVHVQKEHFEIVVTNNRKLILYNTFSYTAREDFIYYILFTAAQLELDPEAFPVYLLGEIEEGDPLYDILYTYVRHVFFGENHCRFLFKEGLKQPGPHEDLVLLNSF
ncbi:MAG: DUF3822 family protein [Sinomicrobium sp.]|nr:DUF3822 family protein [Sinomicrobium sp.]